MNNHIEQLKRIDKTSATELVIGDKTILYSYSTPVAFIYNQSTKRCFVTTHKWSVTTTKHINKWLCDHYQTNVTRISQEALEKLINA